MHLLTLLVQLCCEDYELCCKISAIVEEVVLAQSRMARCLNSQPALLACFVQTDALVYHVLVSAAEAVVPASLFADILCKSVRSYRVGYDCASRMLIQYNGRYKRNERIAVDWFALSADDSRTVYVCIEDYTEVGIAFFHSLADRSHRLTIFRVRNMVREASVRIEELAALCVGAKHTQYLLEESAIAVACVYNNVHALKRMLIIISIHTLTDVVGNMTRVDIHEVEC